MSCGYLKASENIGETHLGFSHRFGAASSKCLVYGEWTEVSFGACWRHQGMGNHPAFKDGWGTMTVFALWLSNIHLPFQISIWGHSLPWYTVCWGHNEGPILLCHEWPREPLAGVGAQCQGPGRFCCPGCVLTDHLFQPWCCGLAPSPLKRGRCWLLQPPLSSLNWHYISSGFICQIGFCCFYPKNPWLSQA